LSGRRLHNDEGSSVERRSSSTKVPKKPKGTSLDKRASSALSKHSKTENPLEEISEENQKLSEVRKFHNLSGGSY
jgi:hypothetical protein